MCALATFSYVVSWLSTLRTNIIWLAATISRFMLLRTWVFRPDAIAGASITKLSCGPGRR
jgi:hypothetical protein